MPPDPPRSSALRGNYISHSIQTKNLGIYVNCVATDFNPNLLFEVTTTAPELEGILSKINVNKAPGVDKLPVHISRTCAKKPGNCPLFENQPILPQFIREIAGSFLPTTDLSLQRPFQYCENKVNIVVVVVVSLLPIPAKCLRIVHSAIYDHISPFITEWQHGFI